MLSNTSCSSNGRTLTKNLQMGTGLTRKYVNKIMEMEKKPSLLYYSLRIKMIRNAEMIKSVNIL